MDTTRDLTDPAAGEPRARWRAAEEQLYPTLIANRSTYQLALDQIQAVVDESIKNIAADKRINKFFAGANIPRLRRQLADQICVAAGGPCIYTGRDMKSAHAGMGVRNSQFNALVQDVGKALNKFKVPKREQKELVAALAGTRKDIVTR